MKIKKRIALWKLERRRQRNLASLDLQSWLKNHNAQMRRLGRREKVLGDG
ncbi:hypothetical protein [Parasphingopyxis sp.]|nr:hypothetical protein [Parasphingopyxis sp.]